MSMLEQIHSPADLQGLSVQQLQALCGEIRQRIITTVSHTGGHLASNLGTVELTVALRYVFPSVQDEIVWDVGHQAYTHKILTGRNAALPSMRSRGGLSGFPNRHESPWDPFTVGHASTSISAALGIAQAKLLKGEPGAVIAVIGDGALTGGLAYEGLNNAGRFPKNFIVILNDNSMSISRNVGGIARYLAQMRTKPSYRKAKTDIESLLSHAPLVGAPLSKLVKNTKTAIRSILYNSTLFEDMGFFYYGPFDGHDLPTLLEVLRNARTIDHPVLLHVVTEKGRGYTYAEQNPGAFHGVSQFDIATGEPAHKGGETFSGMFGDCLCRFAEQDPAICAISAAMKTGTGLQKFSRAFPRRFFDTGIAEEHAVTFAGGLASHGMRPVFAVYSTFLQRGYDQIIHDTALQGVKVVFAVDRAGIVGEDGETHQGVFDAAFFNAIPGVTVLSPCYFEELYQDLRRALYELPGVVAVRYPRGGQPFCPAQFQPSGADWALYGEAGAPVLLVTYGRLFAQACRAQERLLHEGVRAEILKLNQIKPLPAAALDAAQNRQAVFFFEEGMRCGGVGEHFAASLLERGFHGKFFLQAIDRFVPHETVAQALADLKLDSSAMVQIIKTEWGK